MSDFLSETQKENIAFFNENLQKWASDPIYKMKFAVINEKKLQGIFDTFELALGDAVTRFHPNDFVVQQIITRDETVNFLFPALAN